MKRCAGWLLRPRWSRLDGAVLLGLGWLLASDHRTWSRVAILCAAAFGVGIFSEILRWCLRLNSAGRSHETPGTPS